MQSTCFTISALEVPNIAMKTIAHQSWSTSWLSCAWTPSRGDAHEEAKRVFDERVRQAVPEALKENIGCSGVPCLYSLIFSLPLLGEAFDSVGSEVASDSLLDVVCAALRRGPSGSSHNSSVLASSAPLTGLSSQGVHRSGVDHSAARRLRYHNRHVKFACAFTSQ